jgi:hypothetical protein
MAISFFLPYFHHVQAKITGSIDVPIATAAIPSFPED